MNNVQVLLYLVPLIVIHSETLNSTAELSWRVASDSTNNLGSLVAEGT